MPNKAIFLDRDSKSLKTARYKTSSLMRFTPRAVESLALLQKNGYKLFIINSHIEPANHYFSEFGLVDVARPLFTVLQISDLSMRKPYVCQHHSQDEAEENFLECDCRKPKPGLVLRTAQECNIDLSQSWFVGDSVNEVQSGWRAGCRTILVSNNTDTEGDTLPYRYPDFIAYDLAQATRIIAAMCPVQEKKNVVNEYRYLASA